MPNILLMSKNTRLKTEVGKYLEESSYKMLESQANIFDINILNTTHLVILDVTSFPNESSSLIARIKNLKPSLAVLVLVNQGDVLSATQALRVGAVDVLTIPIDGKTLLKTVADIFSHPVNVQGDQSIIQQAIALLQSIQTSYLPLTNTKTADGYARIYQDTEPSDVIHIGDLVIDLKQRRAFYLNTLVDLTPSQFSLLAYLGKENGVVITFEDLYFYLHGIQLDRTSARIALAAHLSYLRAKLSEAGCKDYLVNIRGRGYMLEIPENAATHNNRTNLDLLLERLPVILWTTDSQLRLTSVLGAGLTKLHLKAEDVIGKSIDEIFSDETERLYALTAHQQALKDESVSYEQVFEGRIFQAYIEPSYNSDDEVTGCIGLGVDITERKEAEEDYQRLVNHSLQGIAIFQNNRIVFANPAITEIIGYTVDEILSLNDPGQLIYVEDRSWVYDNIQKRLAGESVPTTSEFRFCHKDGSLRWVEQTAFLTSFHNQLAIQVAITDRTKEKQAVEARRQSEEMYRVLAKNLPHMAVLIFDHDLRYLIAEGQSLEEAGYIRQNVEGKTIWEVLPSDRVEALIPYYYAALAGQEMTFEWIAPTTNKTYEIQTLPVKNVNGQIVAGMFLIQNITRYKNAKQ